MDINKWISVEERMPDSIENGWVLCAVKTQPIKDSAPYYLVPQILEYQSGKWRDQYGFVCDTEFESVTHWQPLPTNPCEGAT
jgi:hypothetical protein